MRNAGRTSVHNFVFANSRTQNVFPEWTALVNLSYLEYIKRSGKIISVTKSIINLA